jgi:hypothetical protein
MLENLSYVADIVGVVLVVASLIYVAGQLHQNTEMLRSNARQAALDAELDNLNSLIEHPVNLRNLDEVELTESEKLRVRYMIMKALNRFAQEPFHSADESCTATPSGSRTNTLDPAAWTPSIPAARNSRDIRSASKFSIPIPM